MKIKKGIGVSPGVAIAQAVVEYLYTTVQARCLFATHYHELTTLKDRYPGIESFYAASKKTKAGIVFLYTMVKGVADGSFGLEVAKLAQLPDQLVARADAILHGLTSDSQGTRELPVVPATVTQGPEAGGSDHTAEIARLQRKIVEHQYVMQTLESIDYDDLSPKKAFDLLWELKKS